MQVPVVRKLIVYVVAASVEVTETVQTLSVDEIKSTNKPLLEYKSPEV